MAALKEGRQLEIQAWPLAFMIYSVHVLPLKCNILHYYVCLP